MKHLTYQMLRDIEIIGNGLDQIDKKKLFGVSFIVGDDSDLVGEEIDSYLKKLTEMLNYTELKEIS